MNSGAKHAKKDNILIFCAYMRKKTLSTVINCHLLARNEKKNGYWIYFFIDICFGHFQGQKKFYTATSKYEYKSSSGGGGSSGASGKIADSSVTDVYKQNINQLDNLLSDLERERDSSLDRSKFLE